MSGFIHIGLFLHIALLHQIATGYEATGSQHDSLIGRYECHKYDNGGKNNWHYVNITRQTDTASETDYIWSNRAGVTWSLYVDSSLGDNELRVGEDCPYYDNGHTVLSMTGDGVLGPWGELYNKESESAPVDPVPFTQTTSAIEPEDNSANSCGCEADGIKFCNFDYGSSGSCELCSSFESPMRCRNDGLPAAGIADCLQRCFPDRSHDDDETYDDDIGKSCPGCEENGMRFCNFDYGDSGVCESCSKYENEDQCNSDGLPEPGAADCRARCFTNFQP